MSSVSNLSIANAVILVSPTNVQTTEPVDETLVRVRRRRCVRLVTSSVLTTHVFPA